MDSIAGNLRPRRWRGQNLLVVVTSLLMLVAGLGIALGPSNHDAPLGRLVPELTGPPGGGPRGGLPSGLEKPGASLAEETSPGVSHGAKDPPRTTFPPVVNDTLVLFNNTLVRGNFAAGNGPDPEYAAYDPAKGEVFFSAEPSSVGVINDTSDRVVQWIPVVDPQGLVYDSGKGEIFVADLGEGNVSVINDTSNTVVATVSVGGYPVALAYDSGLSEIFVTNSLTDYVSVINDTNNTVVHSISIGGVSIGIAYDSGTGEIWVANNGENQVDMIEPMANTVGRTIGWGGGPYAVAYVSGEGEICVTDTMEGGVGVIDDTNFSIVAWVGVGDLPRAVIYDPNANAIVVDNELSDNLTVISALNNVVGSSISMGTNSLGLVDDPGQAEIFIPEITTSVVSVLSDSTFRPIDTIATGVAPGGLALDSGRGEVFVADTPEGNVTVFSDVSDSIVATVPLPGAGPGALVYDSAKGEIFVADGYDSNVSVISDSNNTVLATIPVGLAPEGVAYDPAAGEIFVTDEASNELSILSDQHNAVVMTLRVGTNPSGVVYDAGTQQVFVGNLGSDNVSVISALNDTLEGTVTLPSGPSSLTYDPARGEIFVADGSSGNVTVIADSNDTVVATVPGLLSLQNGEALPAITYEARTGDVYVTAEYSNYVSVLSDATDSVEATFEVGMNPDGATYDPTTGVTYISNYGQGTISIVYQAVPPPTYPVTFLETGLPNGTSWYVNITGEPSMSAQVSGDTGTTLLILLVNGSYPYSVATNDSRWSPVAISPFVVDGSGALVNVTFHEVTYAVAFTENGLPSGENWSVTFDAVRGNVTTTGGTDTLTFAAEPNGTYLYSVAAIPGYLASPDHGGVTVAGGMVDTLLTFTPSVGAGEYLVSFEESGLPAGALWGVTANGESLQSSTAWTNFSEPNGTVSFEVGSVAGFTASPRTGGADVNGAPLSLSIAFTVTPPPPPPNGTGATKVWGLPPEEAYALLAGIALAALLGGVAGVWLRRRRKTLPPVPGPSPMGRSGPPPG